MTANENFFSRKFEYDFEVHYRHYQRYMQALQLVGSVGKNERWLDCACGSGYGTQLLAGFAESVVGYDINREALHYAKQHHEHEYCTFIGKREKLLQYTFDTVVSIETIEHMARDKAVPFLKMLHQILKENGVLAITTPLVPESNPQPTNPFHKYEYSYKEFVSILAEAHFHIDLHKEEMVTFTDEETKSQAYFRCIRSEK